MAMLGVTRDIGPTGFAVCRAAMECGSFDEITTRLQVTNLGEMLAESRALRDAFDRGRRLRQLKDLGSTPYCMAEVARRMGLGDEADLHELFAKDAEAKDIFTQARHALAIQSRAALLKAAEVGNPYAVKTLDRLIRSTAPTPEPTEAVDFHRLSTVQMERAVGIKRQQLIRWRERHNLPANEDGSWSLVKFVHWIRSADVGRVRTYRRKPTAVAARIAARVQQIVSEELGRGSE
ncbi:MAG: hypothetical protein FJ280_26845 [Planctomycetes bacterium]|nr:hypothetical protein [Planctomycetota bacterium]